MKKIKIKICNYNPEDPFSYGRFFISRLKSFYDVELSNIDPDYVFFNEKDIEYLQYPDAIRIFYTGENVSPNFNLCDYALSFDYCTFSDRHFRLPLYISAIFYNEDDIAQSEDLNFENISPMTPGELQEKTGFCSFVYSNYLADPRRKDLFNALTEYKKVDSGGRYLNNVGGPVKNKLAFERAHKFSIAFENSSREGYTTEKLPAALAARTIPIYFGNPLIGREFNEERILNVHAFPSYDALVARVRELDQDDDAYLDIVNRPILAEGYHFNDIRHALDTFLQNIFDQPHKLARRATINTMHATAYQEKERVFAHIQSARAHTRSLAAYILKPLKNSPFIQRLKERRASRKHHNTHI